MYDAIVVGARCAGAPTAMLLARAGCKVLLVDRASFPSDIPHGHLIHRHGPGRLAAWGLLDRVTTANCPAIKSMTTDTGDFALTGHDLMLDNIAVAYGPRRSALDAMLVQAAVESGVELRTGFPVQEYIGAAGRVEGIRARGRNGEPIIEKATITIGADGRNSQLARAVSAPAYESIPSLSCWYFSYWSGVDGNALEIHTHGDHVIFAFPTNDDLFAVFIAWRAEQLGRIRGDIEGSFASALASAPSLAERVRAGKREERFYGATDVPNFMRKPFGPGWALVGDAGVHKDPYGALGVCDAFRDAELLSNSLVSAFSAKQSFDEALAEFERLRNEATLADFQDNAAKAKFPPVEPKALQLRRALRDNPEQTLQFYLAFERRIPLQSFFNPENIARIVGESLAATQLPAN
jgi:flavin-dependent dehydrogenase